MARNVYMATRNVVARYRERLNEMRDYLLSYGDVRWAPVLEQWIVELDQCAGWAQLSDHARRTLKATGGMGSLGDLSISPANGHSIANDRAAIGEASGRLWEMTRQLYDDALAVTQSKG